MRYGFTTGSCSAAAAKAAAYMLLIGGQKEQIEIETPKGILYRTEIEKIKRGPGEVSCAVKKDGGDDPDVTSGMYIHATVTLIEENLRQKDTVQIDIDGGVGIGRVTKPGLDQPVGAAAINHVPRKMIKKEVKEVCEAADFRGHLKVCIWSPTGEEVAKQTFNPRLGIEGGISIIGTSGIVEPMSMQALLDTIRVELNQRRAQGYSYVAVSPGNYGLDFMKQQYGYDLDRSVKCSNFIGATIDMTVELGFEGMLLTGHIGKLIKVSGGIMNTHSKEGDCRMELLCGAAIRRGASAETAGKILDCLTTEEAIGILKQENLVEPVMDEVMKRVMFYLNKRSGGKMEIACILYSNEFGLLKASEGVEKWLTLLVQEQGQ